VGGLPGGSAGSSGARSRLTKKLPPRSPKSRLPSRT